MDLLWGDSGPDSTWIFDPLGATVGTRIDLSGDVICYDPERGACLLYTWPGKLKIRIFGGLCIEDDVEHVAIYGALYMDCQDMPGFMVDRYSEVLPHKRLRLQDFFQLIELCSGMGIATQGFEAAGLSTVLANELRPEMARAFKCLHPEIAVVTGSINDPGTVVEIFQQYNRSAVLAAGFSCQPYSTGGKCQGALDERSATLKGVLDAVKMLRCPVCILECVSKAGTNRYVRKTIEAFCREFQFHLSERVLRLEDCWTTRRERWWAVITAPCFGVVSIPPLPCIPFPAKVKHILPQPLEMDFQDMQELLLTEKEMRMLLEMAPKYNELYLQLNGKCPTCLHSWGSQFDKCPCGCREAFNPETLRTRGVYGVFIPSRHSIDIDGFEQPRLRHIHPTEMAWLNGMVAPDSWPSPLRLAMAGLGQQASPIQSLWVGAQVVRHIGMLQFGASEVSGSQILDTHMKKIFQQIQLKTGALGHVGLFSPPAAVAAVVDTELDDDVEMAVPFPEDFLPWTSFVHQGDGCSVTIVDSVSKSAIVVKLHAPSVTLDDLLLAERALSSDARHFVVIDCTTDQNVGPHDLVAGRCLWFEPGVVDKVESPPAVPMVEANPAVSPTLPWPDPIESVALAEPSGVKGKENDTGVDPSSLDPHDSLQEEPLMKLHDEQFVAVLPPKVETLRAIQALGNSMMSSSLRARILQNQVGKWSDDEISWHALRILHESGKTQWAFLPVLLASECLRRNGVQLIHQWLESLSMTPTVILGVVAVGGHWIPFMWTWTSSGLTASSWDVAGNAPRCLNVLHDAISKAVGARTYTTHTDIRQFATNDFCGLCAVRWLDHRARGKMLPTDMHEVQYLHEIARAQYLDFLRTQSNVPRPWIWAAGLDVKAHARAHDLLIQHGVAPQQVESRLKMLLHALGSAEMQNALASGNPWRTIKSLANQQKPPLKIVFPEELEMMVKARSNKGEVSSRKKAKGIGKGKPTRPPLLDPSKLEIEDGSFVANDKVIPQVQIQNLGPLVEGVVLTTVSGIEAHLKAGQPLTDAGLAALVLNAEESQLDTSLTWSQVRVVLRCKANGQPMLVTAFLVQLGRSCVVPSQKKPMFDMPEVAAACIKVAIYRDAVECPWSEIVAGPIRYLLSILTPLVMCNDCAGPPHGSCVKWHQPPQSVVAEPILDIWRRQWTSSTFKACEPEVASIFWVNVRYLLERQSAVLRCSGYQGVFVEPRSLDGKSGIDSYQVLWLPKESLGELQRLQQCHVMIEGLARLGARMGLRVASENAPALSRLVKPGTVYLATGERLEFEVGPLPYGMDRLSMTRLCESWKWQARPLHPVRSLAGALGTVWLLQSCTEPPAQVMKYKGGEIVINKVVRRPLTVSNQSNPVVGAADTMDLCKMDEVQAKVDPWLKEDPWQQAAHKPMMPTPGGAVVGSQIQQLEDRIEKNLLMKLTGDGDVDMEQKAAMPEMDARVVALEQQVQTLVAKQTGLEVKLDESIQRGDAQISQFQSQVSAQFEAQRNEMQGLFGHQMSQIEALLNKKARHE